MYTKDKKTRMTLRLNDNQFNFVKDSADLCGVSPSDFLRMVINSAMMSSQYSFNLTEGLGRENDKTDFDN